LFYIAFVKANSVMGDYCHDLSHFDKLLDVIQANNHGGNPYCLDELALQLTSLVIISQVTAKVLEWVLPWGKHLLRVYREEWEMRKRGLKDVVPISNIEDQAMLEPHEGVFSEYNKLIIQIGYVVLFAPSFPVAAAVCYIGNLSEIRTDAYKLLVNTQRPSYQGAEDIGSWMQVLRTLAVIGVMTNMGLFGFTSVQFREMLPFNLLGVWQVNEDNKFIFLFLVEHLILLLQLVVMNVVPDEPRDLQIKKAMAAWEAKVEEKLEASRSGRRPSFKGRGEWRDEDIPAEYFMKAPSAPPLLV